MNGSAALPSPDALMERATALVDAGRTGAARPLLAAIRRMTAASPELASLSARLAMREERLFDATQELDAAVEHEAEHAGLRKLRAELRLRCGDVRGAAMDAADAVVLEPADPAAKALLGVILLQLDRTTDSVACLAEAVRAEPANAAFLQALATSQEASGDIVSATATLEMAMASSPGAAGLRSAAILLRVRQRDHVGAVACAEAARRAGVADACVFGLKGHALSSLGRHGEAAESYRQALKLAPDDPYVRHLVAASGTLPSALRAPEAYLRAVFDGYANRFEEHILALGYRIPGLLRGALLRHGPNLGDGSAAGRPAASVLDLGCGTGLLAVACSDLPLGDWEGVDISPRMLAEAAGKDLYIALHEADLLAWLATEERQWPVILAADVFCYFGALDEAFARVRGRLRHDGIFVLSLEEQTNPVEHADREQAAWTLRQQGRYAHKLHYLETAARGAGLRVRELRREALRRDGGAPVPGFIAVLGPVP